MRGQNSSFIREGETCWRRTRAGRAALLFDGAGYYAALRSSLLRAKRRVFLVGWDIDSRAPIRGEEPPDDGAPEALGPLLSHLVEREPELVVHVLLWDYSLLYALDREPLPRLNLDWRTPRRVRVCLDNRLPLGSSHHEKLAVIDDNVAYCGGLDLTIRRWDRPAHAAADGDRVDPGGAAYGPYHDLQMVVDGDTAKSLAEIARGRWNRAAGGRLRAVDCASDPWPEGVEPDLCDIAIGISRSHPKFEGEPEARQIEAAYLDAIAAAERCLYLENQYLTVPSIAAALQRRLREHSTLELIIVNPKSPRGWLEAHTMGVRRSQFLSRLADESIADRVRVLYPWVAGDGERVPVMVHAKLMVVDDRLLHIGSANLNCRSMGMDRECDLHIEAGTDRHRETIGRLRRRLLAHHLGSTAESLAAAEAKHASVIDAIDAHASDERGLEPLPRTEGEPVELPTELLIELADAEKPIDPEAFFGDLFGAESMQPIKRHLTRLIGALVVVGVALALWRYTPLADWARPERIAAVLERVSTSAWAGPMFLAAFVVGSLFAFPVTVLIAATAIALGPVGGFGWAFVGSLLAAAVTYACGRLISPRRLERWIGTWITRVSERLRRGGVVSIMILRNVPVAPFTVVNVIAGATTIPFWDYLIGTALGMGPGIAALTILGDRIRGLLQQPTWSNAGLFVLAAGLWIGVALGLQSLSNRFADDR